MTTHAWKPRTTEDQFGLLVTARLDESADDLPHDISERLKVARTRALEKRRVVAHEMQTAQSPVVMGDTMAMGAPAEHPSLWGWLGSLVPLVALILGIFFISLVQDQIRAHELASVDAELLTDVLPPAAYTDPGFAQFLKSNGKD